jgi:hypothetical protein
MKRWLLLCALACVAWPQSGYGQDDTAPSPALLKDAEWYAERYKVSFDEAVRRLQLQPKVGDLDAALAGDQASSFGGLWLEHDPVFRVVVNFTHGAVAPPSLSAWRDSWGVPIEVRSVRWSLAELKNHQLTAMKLAQDAEVQVGSDINVHENRVEVHVLDGERTKLAHASPAFAASVDVVVVDGPGQPLALVYGGLSVNPGCTAGFTVSKVVGGVTLRGILTSDHCGHSLSLPGQRLVFQGGAFGGSQDVQWYSACGTDISDDFNSGDGLRDVSGTIPRANQSIGWVVCKYGRTTGRTCGVIDRKDYAPLGGIFSPTFIRVEGGDADVIAAGGDSGGPWYSGSAALGITFQRPSGSNDAAYMAIDYISALGVSVLTSDPSGGSCTGCSVGGCQLTNPKCCPGWTCVPAKPGSSIGLCQ